MTDQLKKTGAQATLAGADDSGYHHVAVVVGNPLGNTSKELKRHHEKRI